MFQAAGTVSAKALRGHGNRLGKFSSRAVT